jgi:hypothetical protein
MVFVWIVVVGGGHNMEIRMRKYERRRRPDKKEIRVVGKTLEN